MVGVDEATLPLTPAMSPAITYFTLARSDEKSKTESLINVHKLRSKLTVSPLIHFRFFEAFLEHTPLHLEQGQQGNLTAYLEIESRTAWSSSICCLSR